MSRTPFIVNHETIHALRLCIKNKSNLNCNNLNDIAQLSVKIKIETNECLSIQTLNRLFGLIKNNFNPSLVTLDILSRYLNYNSFSEFEALNINVSKKIHVQPLFGNLLKFLFSNIDTLENETVLYSMFENIYKLIDRNELDPEQTFQIMSHSPIGRKYFFTKFVYIDRLNSWYGKSLEWLDIYRKTKEEEIFVNTTLAFKYFLNYDKFRFEIYFSKLNGIDLYQMKNVNLIILARFVACNIYNVILFELNINSIEDQLDHISNLLNDEEWDIKESLSAKCIITEALILASANSIAYRFINNLKHSGIETSNNFQNLGLANQFNLLKLIVRYNEGVISKIKAKEELKIITSTPFDLMSPNYYQIFISLLTTSLELVIPDFNFSSIVNRTSFLIFKKITTHKAA